MRRPAVACTTLWYDTPRAVPTAPPPRGLRGVLTDRRVFRPGDPAVASSSGSPLTGLGSDLGFNSGAA